MSALAHYIPNYNQYYQYRRDQPYYIFPSERQSIVNNARSIIPEIATSDILAPFTGLPALAAYAYLSGQGEYEKQRMNELKKEEDRIRLTRMEERKLQREDTMNRAREQIARVSMASRQRWTVPPIAGPEAPLPSGQHAGPIVVDDNIVDDEPMYIEPIPKFDFDVPKQRWIPKGGIKHDSTIEKNINILLDRMKEEGYSNVINSKLGKVTPGADLLTVNGLRDAAFDPERYIPTNVVNLTSNRVKTFLNTRKSLPSFNSRPQTWMTYEDMARVKYLKDIYEDLKKHSTSQTDQELVAEAETWYDHYKYKQL